MGQIHVASVRVESLLEVWTALGRAGFTVTVSDTADLGLDRSARCSRGDRQLVIQISDDGRDLAETLVVVAHPPYSFRPWRWGGDIRFFNDLTDVLDNFKYRD